MTKILKEDAKVNDEIKKTNMKADHVADIT